MPDKIDLDFNLEKISYDEAMEMLEATVLNLEEGKVDLDSLVSEYKKGVALLNHCRAKVESAEIHVREANLEFEKEQES